MRLSGRTSWISSGWSMVIRVVIWVFIKVVLEVILAVSWEVILEVSKR